MHPVQGTLTYRGEPIERMLVCFDPVDGDKNPGSSGVTDEQGKFKLKVGKTMGVAPGEYIVYLQDPAEIMGGRTSTDPSYLEILKKYSDPQESKIRITIEKAKYDYQLKLD